MNRARTVVFAVACAIVTACGGEKSAVGPTPVVPPKTEPRSPTVVISSVALSITKETFPEQMLHASASGKDTLGNPISSGFIWEIDGKVISSEVLLEKSLPSGTYQICLSALGVKTCSTITISPPAPIVFNAFVADPVSGPLAVNLKACARENVGGVADCVNLDPVALSASLLTKYSLSQNAILTIECQQECDLTGSVAVVKKDNLSKPQNFVVLRKDWLIQSGRWAGKVVQVSPEKGYAPAMGGYFFYPRTKTPSGWFYQTQTWAKASFPIKVAIDRSGSDSVESGDSIRIWTALAELHNEFGTQLFRPAEMSELTIAGSNSFFNNTYNIYKGGVGIQIKTTYTTSRGGPNATDGVLDGGGVFFKRSHLNSWATRENVKHEFVHTLGIGHSSGRIWQPGLMTDSSGAINSDPLRGVAIPEEVAHIQAYYAVRELELEHKAYGMGNIHQYERISKGLSLEDFVSITYGGNISGSTSAMVANDEIRSYQWQK